MISKIKLWIFRRICLGAREDKVINSFPCAYCKHYIDEVCQVSKKLGL